MTGDYVELHAQSAFSFLRGASLPEEYVEVCQELGLSAIALADCDGVYGAPRLHMAAKRTEGAVKAHVGASVRCTDGSFYPLLVKHRKGYQNLCRLITKAKLRAPKHPQPGQEAAATVNEFAEHAEGLICSTGGDDGPLAIALRQGLNCARSLLSRLRRDFGRDNVYVELQRHGIREQEEQNEAAIDLAREHGLPLVATNGVRYARPEQRQLLDVFTCLRHSRTLETAGRLLTSNAERYLKPAATMRELFVDYPEAIAHTCEISSRLEFTMTDLGYEFPPYPTPNGESMDDYLRRLVEENAPRRFPDYGLRHRQQLETELAVIAKLGLAGYFLIVWDIVEFCRSRRMLVQGRGSAGNSAVCFALGITSADPIKYELLFERFLSEVRGEWPDIDLDLPSGTDREQVIQYVYRRYGRRGAAMCANVITYRKRLAIREVGKVFGFSPDAIATLSSLSPQWESQNVAENLSQQFRHAGLDICDPRIRKFFELVNAIQNLPRHLGQHSGGMIISGNALDSVVPLEPASMEGRVVLQWDKDDCADMKLIKIDLLGLGMMAALRDTMDLIAKHRGIQLTLATIPDRDPAVFETLKRADTIGLFQVESRAQQASLPRTKPETFYDLVTQVAIIRPGPIVGKMMHPYIARRQGKEKPDYPHPSLEPVLRRTLGVPLFQEQLLRVAMVAANFSGAEAEELRRAMGAKRSEEKMRHIEGRLRDGMATNGIVGATQDQIVQAITSFALYGFPESHAIAFALLAYASAYLKHYYLPEFLCALLNCQPMGFYAPSTLVKDAQRHGLRVLPIDINRSRWNCTVENGSLRLGLRYARGVRAAVGTAIEVAQPFSDIGDLMRRVSALKKSEAEVLAFIGAFNSIGAIHRRDALWQVSRAGRPAGPLLDSLPEQDTTSPLTTMDLSDRIIADYKGTSITVGQHPMAHRRQELNELGVIPARHLAPLPNGRIVRVAGNVIVRQRPQTAKGFVFVSLEDETGICNLIVTPNRFEQFRVPLLTAPYLIAEGPLQNADGVIHVRVSKVQALAYSTNSIPSHDFR